VSGPQTAGAAAPDHVPTKLLGWLSTAVLVAGIVLRLVVWAQQRAVYLDEVNLLRNFLERDYAGLFRPLRYEQYAPPLFSVLMKATVSVFGAGELAIRALPVACSIGTVVLLRGLGRRWLAPLPAVLALAWVAFGPIFLDYGTVCKQYAADGLVALALLAGAEAQARHPAFTGRAAAAWLLAGAVAVWLSMPAVFVLAGVGLFLAHRYRAGLWGGQGLRLVVVGAAWGLSFLGYFLLLLRADAQSDYLQRYHQDAFLAFPPRSGAEWQLLGAQLHGILDKAIGKTVLALVVSGLGLGLGVVALVRRQPGRGVLLLVPLAACLLASALHYYSLVPRLLLFGLPLLIVVVAAGLQVLLQSRYRAVQGVALLAALLVLGNQQRLANLWRPLQSDYADVAAGLRHVAARQRPGDVVFVYYLLEPVYEYYAHLRPHPLRLPPAVVERYRPLPGGEPALVAADVTAARRTAPHRLWLVYDHPEPWLREWAATQGRVAENLDFYRGYAFVLEER